MLALPSATVSAGGQAGRVEHAAPGHDAPAPSCRAKQSRGAHERLAAPLTQEGDRHDDECDLQDQLEVREIATRALGDGRPPVRALGRFMLAPCPPLLLPRLIMASASQLEAELRSCLRAQAGCGKDGRECTRGRGPFTCVLIRTRKASCWLTPVQTRLLPAPGDPECITLQRFAAGAPAGELHLWAAGGSWRQAQQGALPACLPWFSLHHDDDP